MNVIDGLATPVCLFPPLKQPLNKLVCTSCYISVFVLTMRVFINDTQHCFECSEAVHVHIFLQLASLVEHFVLRFVRAGTCSSNSFPSTAA